jgi:choline dehydrogenase-like flavoprotein
MDWPLGYDDIAPYYDIVERYVGISGLAEGVYELPDGQFLPAMPFTCPEVRLRTRVKEKFGRTVTIGRSANLTRPLNGRAACHYCGPCERGCMTHSYFNSAFTTMADALATGRCTHVPDAMVFKVLMDPDAARVRGVLYIDRNTRQPSEIYGQVVVLCAQALESVRVLFNSATTRFPNGVANSSGVLGHYLQDHIWNGGGANGEFPDLPAKPSLGAPRRPNGIYIIRFRNTKAGPRSKKFLRGYGFQGGWGGPDFNWSASGFGETFKRALLDPVVSLNLGGFGECLSRRENFVEIDPNVVDAFGIPVLRITMTWTENERAMMADMAESAAEMLEAAGARNVRPWTVLDRMPGMGIHEVGVARMGTDPKTSVLNQFQQTHDVKNLFVMDGSGFTSSACQNPTLTIMALAVRSTDFLLQELKRGNL